MPDLIPYHDFNYCYEQEGYQFPLFKFLEPEHADSMLKRGEIYLPCLSNFCSESSEESLVYDEKEGKFDFKDTYNFTGKGADAPRMPGFNFHPEANINFRNVTIEAPNQTLPDAWVYCVSGLLLSESLSWALKEGKTSCVMILDPRKFRSLLASSFDKPDITEFFPCHYSDEGRVADNNTDVRQFYFFKPKRYESQREVRLVAAMSYQRNHTVTISELCDGFLEIDISGVDRLIVTGEKKGKIIHTI